MKSHIILALSLLGVACLPLQAAEPPLLEFRFAEQVQSTDAGARAAPDGHVYRLDSDVLLAAGDVTEARLGHLPAGTPRDNFFGRCVVELTFSPKAGDRIYAATAERLGQSIAVLVRGEIVTVVGLGGPLRSSAIIDGNYSCDAAAALVTQFNK